MEIKLSVILWTVINFCVIMLILDRLLFKPILKVMHDRNDKIRIGLSAKELVETEIEEKREIEAERVEENRREARIAAENAVMTARKNAIETLEAHRRKNANIEKKFNETYSDEEKRVYELFENEMPQIVSALANKLVLKD